jgi:hypothetical protein
MEISEDEIYSVTGPLVISETIGDETVIIDLEKGSYFSVKGCGAYIWEQLQQPISIREIRVHLSSVFDVESEKALNHLVQMISYLRDEGLVVRSAEPAASRAAGEVPAVRMEFVAPTIEKYTDMEAMLLLDPVHDVDEEGWPKGPADTKTH